MGFQLFNYKLASGMTLNTAYLKITSVSGSKQSISAVLGIYISREHAQNNYAIVDQKSCSFKPVVKKGSVNYHQQTYEYMKTLEEYTNAVDVFEDESINTSP